MLACCRNEDHLNTYLFILVLIILYLGLLYLKIYASRNFCSATQHLLVHVVTELEKQLWVQLLGFNSLC